MTKLRAPDEYVQSSKIERNGRTLPELFRIITGPVARLISQAIVGYNAVRPSSSSSSSPCESAVRTPFEI